ncbi:MAG: FAD:protein FMN transferase [Oscillospiraceae bacterium]|nr:FAD:protein FMN transferase [Oscillospiraceae bacterium]
MKRFLCLLLVLCLTGCAKVPEQKQYTATFLTLFDTVTTVVGKAATEEEFQAKAQIVRDTLETYHQLFDIYNDYEGITNLKTVNDQAGIAPVKVDGQIIALLRDCKAYYEATGGMVNAAMGSVLFLWHKARNHGFNDPANAALPDADALQEAAQHTDFSKVIIDEEASTVYLEDPDMRLDVGAIAKGWAAQRVSETAPEGLLISVGGNVCATGPKDSQGTPWVVGVQDPKGGDAYLHTLYLTKGSIVTSGDYQRAYMVDGQLYHHIIDPHTLYPGTLWRAVTVVCEDSGLADALSTALFLLPQADGQALLDKCGAQAMWVAADGSIAYSPGFSAFIRT